MKRHENNKDEELQRNIDEQEQAMSALLTRVMERPLVPLHKSLGEVKEQLAQVQQANAKAAQAVEAGLSEALEVQGKRMNRHFGDVADGIDSLKEELGRSDAIQAGRDERMQDSVLRTDDVLSKLDAKADATSAAIAATVHELSKVDDALDAARTQQQSVADQLSRKLDGMGVRQEQRHAHLDAGLTKARTMLDQLDTKADAASDHLAAAASAVAKVDTDLGAIRALDEAVASSVLKELTGLTQQLERQQVQLCERIGSLQPELVAQFASLASTFEDSAREAARQHAALSENQKALVTSTVQEQLALQLAPFQARTKWLLAFCGLSFASTVALLWMQLSR